MKKFYVIAMALLSIAIVSSCNSRQMKQDTGNENASQQEVVPVQPEENPAKATTENQPERTGSKALIKTDYGDMTVLLYDETPQHRDNFIKLVEEGYYDGTLFHRVIPDFMIQGGDPDSKGAAPDQPLGRGGPGYTIEAEFHPEYIHKKGALAAARQGDQVNPERRSSGSQFYIVQGKKVTAAELNNIAARTGAFYTAKQIDTYQTIGGTPFLDNQYTVFGEVVDGLDVIDKIAAVKTGSMNRPVNDVKMTIVMLEE